MFEDDITNTHWVKVRVKEGVEVGGYPAPPEGVEVERVSGGVQAVLSWEKSSDQDSGDNDVIGYNIYRSTRKDGGYEKINTEVITVLTYTDSNLSSDITYFYKVVAVDSSGLETPLQYINPVVATENIPPSPPTNLVASDTPNDEGGRIDLSWTLSSDDSLAGDVILIADGSDLNYLDGIDIASVIDCVEYHVSSDHMKEIEAELDRGFGGVGIIKYGGQSIERISAGFDSNNSSVDFEIIDHPTPGYQHE